MILGMPLLGQHGQMRASFCHMQTIQATIIGHAGLCVLQLRQERCMSCLWRQVLRWILLTHILLLLTTKLQSKANVLPAQNFLERFFSSPVMVEGRIFVGCRDNFIYSLDLFVGGKALLVASIDKYKGLTQQNLKLKWARILDSVHIEKRFMSVVSHQSLRIRFSFQILSSATEQQADDSLGLRGSGKFIEFVQFFHS